MCFRKFLSEASEIDENQCENCCALNFVKCFLLVKRTNLSNQHCVADRQCCIALNNDVLMLLRSHLIFVGDHGLNCCWSRGSLRRAFIGVSVKALVQILSCRYMLFIIITVL